MTEETRIALAHAYRLCAEIAEKYSREAAREIGWAGMTYRPERVRRFRPSKKARAR